MPPKKRSDNTTIDILSEISLSVSKEEKRRAIATLQKAKALNKPVRFVGQGINGAKLKQQNK